jgi:two-component system, cell cycle response regulator
MNCALESVSHLEHSDQPTKACERVLVAEDSPMMRTVLRNWLESWGYQVAVAEDGAKAWEMLEAEPVPQILILDWMMPGMDGLELCRMIRVRDMLPYQYILLVTAKDAKQDLVRGLQAGADDYLSKPFDKNELRARLRTGRRILTLQDEQAKIREELHFQATHDGLTGIWNRRAILDMMRREFEIAARSNCTIGVILLDVDHFKHVNDAHGHQAGDSVLKEIANRIQQVIRSYDLAGRYGGEEFLIVLPDCDTERIQNCAERIRSAIASQPIFAEGSSLTLTVSAGTKVLDPVLGTESDALAEADTALYQAKNTGRNRVIAAVREYGSDRMSEINRSGKS